MQLLFFFVIFISGVADFVDGNRKLFPRISAILLSLVRHESLLSLLLLALFTSWLLWVLFSIKLYLSICKFKMLYSQFLFFKFIWKVKLIARACLDCIKKKMFFKSHFYLNSFDKNAKKYALNVFQKLCWVVVKHFNFFQMAYFQNGTLEKLNQTTCSNVC